VHGGGWSCAICGMVEEFRAGIPAAVSSSLESWVAISFLVVFVLSCADALAVFGVQAALDPDMRRPRAPRHCPRTRSSRFAHRFSWGWACSSSSSAAAATACPRTASTSTCLCAQTNEVSSSSLRTGEVPRLARDRLAFQEPAAHTLAMRSSAPNGERLRPFLWALLQEPIAVR
jgi:hypothetical protein